MTNLNGEIFNCIIIFHEEHPNQKFEDIHVRPLRYKFIVTATVDGNITKQEIPRDIVEDRPFICVYIGDGCKEIGPIGNPCDNLDCVDTGNIYTNKLENIEEYIEDLQQSTQEPEAVYYFG